MTMESCFVCFDLGFHTRNPVIKYRPDASCMSYMEARAEMPWENNFQVPIPRAQRVADRVHLRLAFLHVWDSNPQDAEREVLTPYRLSHSGRLCQGYNKYQKKIQNSIFLH